MAPNEPKRKPGRPRKAVHAAEQSGSASECSARQAQAGSPTEVAGSQGASKALGNVDTLAQRAGREDAPPSPTRGGLRSRDLGNGKLPDDGELDGRGRKTGLPAYELGGLFAEAFEAYDMRDDRIRFDSQGRKWTFRLGQTSDQSELHLIVAKLTDERTDRISTAMLATDMAHELIEAVVRAMDEAL